MIVSGLIYSFMLIYLYSTILKYKEFSVVQTISIELHYIHYEIYFHNYLFDVVVDNTFLYKPDQI